MFPISATIIYGGVSMKNKKIFPSKKAIYDFFDKKGFYVVLVLCIAVVSATAYFVTRYNAPSIEEDYDIGKIINSEIADGIVLEEPTESVAKPDPDDTVVLSENEDNPMTASSTVDTLVMEATSDSLGMEQSNNETAMSEDSLVNQGESDEVPAFAMPVYGEVVTVFAIDKLVYSNTLEEWRTHSGIDIAASRGTAVKAVADGVVSEIKHDPRYGITVIIEHQDGLKTVYANLATDDVVLPNQRVEKGDIIGSIGNTAVFESKDESHVHFEVLKDNEPVDPFEYIPDVSNFEK